MTVMIGALGLLGVVLGAVAATPAERSPGHVEALETAAGILLIGGFALAGAALPAVL
jgi:hypothetical protein